MGFWSWVRAVIADRGEVVPIPISLERGEHGRGYAFRLGVRAGFGGQEAARIPVQSRLNEAPHPVLKEVYWCEVAGRTLEAANVYALREKVSRLLDGIAPARTLPLAYFRVPSMDYSLPVYEEDGDIVAPVIAGPKLKAPDLAGIRRHVCNYLTSAGYVSSPEDVVIGVLRPRDLRLVEPAAVFRSLADEQMWIPSVEGVSAEGPVVGVLENAARLAQPERRRAGGGPLAQDQAPAAPDVISLLRFVRAELERGGRTQDTESIYACDVRPEIWTVAEARCDAVGSSLVAHLTDDEATVLTMPIRRAGAGDVTVALEDRGISVFLEPTEALLAQSVGRYLHAHGFLRFPEEVEEHAAEQPRAERLEADEIWSYEEVR